MATSSLAVVAAAAARRTFLVRAQQRASFHGTVLRPGGGGHTPPLPPFARSPRRTEPMTENSDVLWDDGVAPELALDFDVPNVSSREALYTCLGVFAGFFALFQTINFVTNGAVDDNPAFSHDTDCVDLDYSNHAVTPLVSSPTTVADDE